MSANLAAVTLLLISFSAHKDQTSWTWTEVCLCKTCTLSTAK